MGLHALWDVHAGLHAPGGRSGEPPLAKRSTNASYVPMALTADRWAAGGRPVTLVPDAFATRVVTADDGGEVVARAVTWRDTRTGGSFTEEAKVVVLAGGCTETPRAGHPRPVAEAAS